MIVLLHTWQKGSPMLPINSLKQDGIILLRNFGTKPIITNKPTIGIKKQMQKPSSHSLLSMPRSI